MSDFFHSALRGLGYVVSLPERTLRSLAAVAGGTTSLLTETLFPEALRGTTLYKVFLGDAQQFIITRVAQIEQQADNAADTGGAGEPATDLVRAADVKACTDPSAGDSLYLPRKMVGGALETAGLFAMHFSPLWVFAIAGDAAAGTSVFLQRLTAQLKKNGVVPEDTQVTGLADLLGVIQETSRKSATAIDTPPLSREELGKLADDMLSGYGQMFTKATDLLPRMESIWAQMVKVADVQNVSLDTLSGILTMDVAAWGKKGVGAVLALGQTGTDLLGEKILDSYAATLEKVSNEGVTQYITQRMTPFLQSAVSHFDPDKPSWTEAMLNKL